MSKIFISQCSANASITTQLVAYLERIGIEHDNIFCSAIIGQGTNNGEEFNKKIGNAINNSDLFIYLISYDFLQSSYCIEELGVGWFLSQENGKTCFYIILPDIEPNELKGFVNTNVQQFTFLDDSKRESFSLLSENIFSALNIKQKKHSELTNYENTFFTTIKNELETLVKNKEKRKNESKETLKNSIQLEKTMEEKDKIIKDLKAAATQEKDEKGLLKKELATIISRFHVLGVPCGINEKQYKAIYKDFWFNMINRYEELIELLQVSKKDNDMEMLIASIYSIENKFDKAYEHYIEAIKCDDSGFYFSYLDIFLSKYHGSMAEIITLLKEKTENEKDGVVKDSYLETIKELEKREKTIKVE